VYVHHYVSSTTFLLGSGAELRGQMTREPLEWPLALVVDGKSLLSSKARLTNIQLISTAGIAPADLAHCLECARLPRQGALPNQTRNSERDGLSCPVGRTGAKLCPFIGAVASTVDFY
jgi:hypothetical protein